MNDPCLRCVLMNMILNEVQEEIAWNLCNRKETERVIEKGLNPFYPEDFSYNFKDTVFARHVCRDNTIEVKGITNGDSHLMGYTTKTRDLINRLLIDFYDQKIKNLDSEIKKIEKYIDQMDFSILNEIFGKDNVLQIKIPHLDILRSSKEYTKDLILKYLNLIVYPFVFYPNQQDRIILDELLFNNK